MTISRVATDHSIACRQLNVGAGPHYAPGWWNTDLVEVGDIRPDQVVEAWNPFPFPDDAFDRVYAGHVIEHVPWADVPDWLAEVRRILVPGGWLMVVGPDAYRTLDLWRDGAASWDQVQTVIEGPGAFQAHLHRFEPLRWGADRHHWNCHEQRVVGVLADAGFDEVTAYPVSSDGRLPEHDLLEAGWPLVDGSPRQFAVHGRNP